MLTLLLIYMELINVLYNLPTRCFLRQPSLSGQLLSVAFHPKLRSTCGLHQLRAGIEQRAIGHHHRELTMALAIKVEPADRENGQRRRMESGWARAGERAPLRQDGQKQMENNWMTEANWPQKIFGQRSMVPENMSGVSKICGVSYVSRLRRLCDPYSPLLALPWFRVKPGPDRPWNPR